MNQKVLTIIGVFVALMVPVLIICAVFSGGGLPVEITDVHKILPGQEFAFVAPTSGVSVAVQAVIDTSILTNWVSLPTNMTCWIVIGAEPKSGARAALVPCK